MLVAATVDWKAVLLDVHMVGRLAGSRADATAVRSVLMSVLIEVASWAAHSADLLAASWAAQTVCS